MAISSAREAQLYDREVAIAPERETLSHALAQSEERYYALTQRLTVGIFRASLDGQLVEVNPALARMLGHASVADLLGSMIHQAFADPLDRDRLSAQLARGPVERASARWRRKDGAEVSVRLSLRTVLDE